MRKHAKARLYTAMLIMMVCAVFVLRYSHWGKVRYRQSIARAGRGILPQKHHHSKHKHRKQQGPGETQHQLHPGPQKKQHLLHLRPERKQHLFHPGPERKQHLFHLGPERKQHLLQPGPEKQHQIHLGLGMRRAGNSTTLMRRKKKGRHEGTGKDQPVLTPLSSNNRVPPLGERGIKPRLQVGFRHRNNSRRLGAKDNRDIQIAQAGKRGRTRTDYTEKYRHPLLNRRQGKFISPSATRLPINALLRRQNDVLSPHFRSRTISKTTTLAPKISYHKSTGAVLKLNGSKVARIGGHDGVKLRSHGGDRPHGDDRLGGNLANDVNRMRQ